VLEADSLLDIETSVRYGVSRRNTSASVTRPALSSMLAPSKAHNAHAQDGFASKDTGVQSRVRFLSALKQPTTTTTKSYRNSQTPSMPLLFCSRIASHRIAMHAPHPALERIQFHHGEKVAGTRLFWFLHTVSGLICAAQWL
jgi:hypothetical protein